MLLLTGARRLSQDPLAAVQELALLTAEPGRVAMRSFLNVFGIWQTDYSMLSTLNTAFSDAPHLTSNRQIWRAST